jgi:hypothetical protein
MRVPAPGGLWSSRRPSSVSTRSASPRSPVPRLESAPPMPSSTSTCPFSRTTRTLASDACAYLATFVRASATRFPNSPEACRNVCEQLIVPRRNLGPTSGTDQARVDVRDVVQVRCEVSGSCRSDEASEPSADRSSEWCWTFAPATGVESHSTHSEAGDPTAEGQLHPGSRWPLDVACRAKRERAKGREMAVARSTGWRLKPPPLAPRVRRRITPLGRAVRC